MPIITRAVSVTPPVSVPELGYISATYYDPAGGAWHLTTPSAGWYTLADGVSGLGAAPIEVTTDPYPRGGSKVRHVQPTFRTIVWPLHVYGATHLEFVGRWRALARAFSRTSRDGPGVLEIARPDGTRRRINVYYQEGFDGQGSRNASSTLFDSAILTLFCEDPYWVDPVTQSVHREYGTSSPFLTPYPTVSSSQVLGATTVTNPGDVIVWPEWTITGPASLITFTRTDTGDAFAINPTSVSGSLLATEKVVVSTDPPRVRKYTAEVQTINLGAATAGTITIGFDGQTTASIAYNATAATVQTALEALSNVDAGDIAVSGGPLPGTISISVAGQYLGTDVPAVTVTPSGLTGGTVTVATTTQGAVVNWIGAVNFPGARLWGLDPGDNDITFQLDGSGAGSAVDLTFNARYETA